MSTRPTHQPLLLLGGLFAILGVVGFVFLTPRGAALPFIALSLSAFLGLAVLIAFLYAQWQRRAPAVRDESLAPAVDIYVLAGDGDEQETLRGVEALSYPHTQVKVLTMCGTTLPEALLSGTAPLVLLLRAGEVPHTQLLNRMVPYFANASLGFVQSAIKYQAVNAIGQSFSTQEALAALHEQGRSTVGATTLRSSGSLIARSALEATWRAGTSARALGLRMQAQGYSAHFELDPQVLAHAPRTVEQYSKTQYAAARSAMGLLRERLVLSPSLPFGAKMQYIVSAFGYLALLMTTAALLIAPLYLLFRGEAPLVITTSLLPLVCLVSFGLVLVSIKRATGQMPSLRALVLMVGAFPAHAAGLISALIPRLERPAASAALSLKPHALYLGLVLLGIVVAFVRDGATTYFLTEFATAAFAVVLLTPFLQEALRTRPRFGVPKFVTNLFRARRTAPQI